MKDIISSAESDPLGNMLLDYIYGIEDVYVEVESPTVAMWTMTGATLCRSYHDMDALDRKALEHCQGRVLDVGACGGCHTLYLQQQNIDVKALDISPGCIEAMRLRGVKYPIHNNLFNLIDQKYSTILMLMNGLGICGTVDGCNLFFQYIRNLLVEGGQIIADSTDLSLYYDVKPDYSTDYYFGETEMVMKYKNSISHSFNWLYIDIDLLPNLCTFNDFICEKLYGDNNGRFLARIY